MLAIIKKCNYEFLLTYIFQMPADGAAVLILADEKTTRDNNLTPLARIVAYACLGVDPHTGLGAAAAVTRLLHATGVTLEDVDLLEVLRTLTSQFKHI